MRFGDHAARCFYVLLAGLGACADPRGPIDTEAAYKLVREQSALFLDVRTPEEFGKGRIDGARNVPLQTLEKRIDEIASWLGGDRSKPVVVYCRIGKRSGAAKKLLEAAGFKHVVNAGGVSDWQKVEARLAAERAETK